MFKAVVESKRGKRRTRLRNLLPTISLRFNEYAGATSNFSKIGASILSPIRHGDCLHCYSGGTAALGKIKTAVVDAIPDERGFYCQYCLISEWDSFDHYMPKEKFPEFAALARNLLPCCPKCNRLKGDAWPPGDPAVLNLYYDDIPDAPFLQVVVKFDANEVPSVRFSLLRVAGISKAVFQRLTNHFERLALIRRYNEAGLKSISDIRRTIIQHKRSSWGKVGTAEFLVEEADGLEESNGANYWKSVLVRKLSTSDAFLAMVLAP